MDTEPSRGSVDSRRVEEAIVAAGGAGMVSAILPIPMLLVLELLCIVG